MYDRTASSGKRKEETLKSKLKKLQSVETIKIPQNLMEVVVRKEEQEKAILHMREQYQTIEPVNDCVKEGDFVVIEQNGKSQCYNTARNFICEELISSCMNHSSGDTVISESGNIGKITEVKRKVLPPFDDTLAQRAGLKSAEECGQKIREELIGKKKKQAEKTLVGYLTEQMVKLSEYELCQEEIKKAAEDMRMEFKQIAKEQGISLLDCVRDFLSSFQVEEQENKTVEMYFEEICAKQQKIILLGSEYLKEFHVVLGREQYEREISRIMKEENIPENVAEEQYSFESFLYEKCLAQVENAMRKYIRNRIEIKITVE